VSWFAKVILTQHDLESAAYGPQPEQLHTPELSPNQRDQRVTLDMCTAYVSPRCQCFFKPHWKFVMVCLAGCCHYVLQALVLKMQKPSAQTSQAVDCSTAGLCWPTSSGAAIVQPSNRP
jgi:hypothetical protein